MPAVIDLKDHKAAPGQVINVLNISFRGAVGSWGDISMVKNDSLEAAFGRLNKGDGQQTVNLVAFGDIADQVLVIIGTVIEFLLKGDLTACYFQFAQVIDGKFLPDFEQIESLEIESCRNFSSEAMEHVGKIHSLKELVLIEVPVGNVGISHLSSCSKLESLKITCCSDEDDKLDNKGVSFLKNLPSLKKLEISDRGFTSDILDTSFFNVFK